MMSLIIVLGVLLILYILYLIFRVGNLVTIAKGKRDERYDSANGTNAALFIVFMIVSLVAFFWYSYAFFEDYTLPLASEHGEKIDSVFWITMAVTVIAFTIISIVMFIFLYQYRYKEGARGSFFPDNHYLELTWTIIPAIVLAILIFTGLRAWNEITAPASAKAEVIEVVGQQFAWGVRYGGNDNQLGKYNFKLIEATNQFGLDVSDDKTHDDFVTLELHIPKGEEVLLKIRAKDVLHSVFLPHFRVKMDAVPGMPTQFKFVATKTTAEMRDELGNQNFNYEMACTEICGRGHFSMKMTVIVDEPKDYENWKRSQESWLKQNQAFLEKIDPSRREAAKLKAGIKDATVAENEVK